MSSSIDKQYGNLYIFGKYKDGYVDVSWSRSQDTIVSHITEEEATNLINAWNSLLNYSETLMDKARRYDELQVVKDEENKTNVL